jgi:hypothetical protein
MVEHALWHHKGKIHLAPQPQEIPIANHEANQLGLSILQTHLNKLHYHAEVILT